MESQADRKAVRQTDLHANTYTARWTKVSETNNLKYEHVDHHDHPNDSVKSVMENKKKNSS